jgi:16S rRNA (cytosine1402-N4)-methyltransferase
MNQAYIEAAGKVKDGVHPYFADMTFGGGGHSRALAELHKTSKVYSVDQDPDAIKNGQELIEKFSLQNNLFLHKMNYEQFPTWVEENNPDLKFHGILMDLGVSSHHFDKFDRGFSFREDAPLDMRMDFQNERLYTAEEVLNTFDEEDIANIIFKYGEERLSRRIAKNIIEARTIKKIETTKELENICFHAYPTSQRHKRIHPATKTFQALRIFVNRELEVLENTIEKLYDLLLPGGVLAVISFHSLEDRIAKHKFKEIFQINKNTAKILTKKPIYPSESELSDNSRSRSAKLRVLQKLN